jgi:hypothetical protein
MMPSADASAGWSSAREKGAEMEKTQGLFIARHAMNKM